MISVLYVDDEPDLLDIGRIFLEESGEFRVGTSTSALEALDTSSVLLYRCHHLRLPDAWHGWDRFFKSGPGNASGISRLSSLLAGREEVVIDAINNGADFYVQKGGDPQAQFADLAHMIRQAVKMRQAQVYIAEQEQRYHDVQNANDLIQSVDPAGHFLFVNKKWQDTLGYGEHDLENLTIFDIIDDESKEYCKNVFPRVIAGENVGIIDVVFKARNGKKCLSRV